jgi:hypothetical protein
MAKSISSLNVGDKIKYGNYQVESETALPIIWNIADKNHTGYPANSVTLVTNKIIDLRGFDGMEAGNADSNRASYGSNRYRTSNLRQWLNSGGLASAWFTAQNLTDGTTNTNNHDASPIDANFNVTTGYATKKGFLNYFSANEQSKILPTTLITAKNTVTDGGSSESVTDNIFLLSTTEVGLTNENSIAEGSLLSLFGTASNRISYLTQQAFTNSRSSSKPSTVGTAWYWWLRTPNSDGSGGSRRVNAAGSLNYGAAYLGDFGVRPALNLSSGILVSDTTDVDGCYTVQWDATPTISGSDANLGNETTSFTQNYTINDTDTSDTLTVTEKVDSTVIRTVSNAVRNQTYTLDLSTNWSTLTLASHTATITVDDGNGGTVVRTFTFTKIDDHIEFTTNPIQTSMASKKIVFSGIIQFLEGSTLNIYACNNGFDTVPTWEEITTEYLNKQTHTFTNTVKTATNWGISTKIYLKP